MSKNQKSSKLSVLEKMPPLFHTIPGQKFNIIDSEVIRWIISQPEILQYIFNKVSKSFLVFDSETHKWKGRNYEA